MVQPGYRWGEYDFLFDGSNKVKIAIRLRPDQAARTCQGTVKNEGAAQGGATKYSVTDYECSGQKIPDSDWEMVFKLKNGESNTLEFIELASAPVGDHIQ